MEGCQQHLMTKSVQVLSEDFSKLVFLTDNRSLEFHARFGFYHRTRVPRHGYDLAYAPFLAHLLVVGDAPEVYRLDLCEGRFYTPLKATSPALNACGEENGVYIECAVWVQGKTILFLFERLKYSLDILLLVLPHLGLQNHSTDIA